MVTHFSILAWRIPSTEEPGRLHSLGSRRVRLDLVTTACGSSHSVRAQYEAGVLGLEVL